MKKRKNKKWLIHLMLIIGAVFMLAPFIWMILTALKTKAEATSIPPTIPEQWQWNNFREIFSAVPFANYYLNTIISTVSIVCGQVFLSAMAAYAFAKINFPFKNFLFILILSVLMMPGQVFLLPQYLIIQRLGLLNSIPALVIPGLFSAFATFLLRQFFMTLPKELDEAAIMDGCSRFRIFFSIILPLSKSALISSGIFAMLFGWNSLMWPLIVNTSPNKRTLSAGLAALNGQFGSDYPLMMAGAFLAILPLVALFLIFQKQFIEGIAFSGSKE